MLKNLFVSVVVYHVFAITYLKAQDTLILNNGMEVHAKIIEIDDASISFKKQENMTGPTYKMNLAEVFMAVYKGGKREVFLNTLEQTNKQNQPVTEASTLSINHNNFEVRLIESKNLPDKKPNRRNVSATIEVYNNSQLFTTLSLFAYQRTDVELDYRNPNESYLNKSYLQFTVLSPRISNLLYEKYESYSGCGHGWALPPKFFSSELSACSIAYLEQRPGNKEILGFGGISSTKFVLENCSTINYKLLSAALLWLEVNFERKDKVIR